MRIEYQKDEGVAIAFNLNELHIALQLLYALYNFCGAEFIKKAIDDIEHDLKPKQLTMVVHNHLCEKCFRMVNDKDDNCLRFERDGDISYRHKECPPLKKDSDRER